jgi:putative salt-induced outer membrane protein YdiY
MMRDSSTRRQAQRERYQLGPEALAAGNFNKLQYARQQAFELDAQAEFLGSLTGSNGKPRKLSCASLA